MNRRFYCPSVTLGGKRIIQRQSPADSARHRREFMTSSFETPRSHIHSGRSDRHLIRFQGFPAHSAIHSSLHIELNWALLDSLDPSFFLFCLFLKSIEVIFPPRPQRWARNDRGPSLAHTDTFHLLQVNSNWLLTFTYPQIWPHHTRLLPGCGTKRILFCLCCPSPVIKWGKITLSLNPSLGVDWSGFRSIVCLVKEGNISPRVVLWPGGVNKQAASGSNYCCMKLLVLEGNKISHGLVISQDTDEPDFTPQYREAEEPRHKDRFSSTTALAQIWQRFFIWWVLRRVHPCSLTRTPLSVI